MIGSSTRRVSLGVIGLTALCLATGLGVEVGRAEAAPAAAPVIAEQRPARKWSKAWLASVGAVAAVNFLDIHSSRGHREANPLFRDRQGRFATGKAIMIKSAIAGGLVGTQWLWMKTHPEKQYHQPFTLINSVVAGGLGAVAIHNYSLAAPRAVRVERAVPSYLAEMP